MQNEEKFQRLGTMLRAVSTATDAIALQHLTVPWSNRMDLLITRLRGILAIVENVLETEIEKTEFGASMRQK